MCTYYEKTLIFFKFECKSDMKSTIFTQILPSPIRNLKLFEINEAHFCEFYLFIFVTFF